MSDTDFLASLDKTQDGYKLVALTFGINLYTGVAFYDCPGAILHALEQFKRRCPPDQARFYATETMRAHKAVTARVLNMPATWLKPGAPRKEYLVLEIKSGQAYQDAPQFKYHMWCVVGTPRAQALSLAFPAAWALERTEDMLGLVKDLCDLFPLTSGLAGFSFERTPYMQTAAETYAWGASMRHVGTDIVRLPADTKAAGVDGVRGVNWLTILGPRALEELGGAKSVSRKLPRQVELINAKNGTIIKAGPVPELGDVNRNDLLPLYRAVFKVVEPLIERAAKRTMFFRIDADNAEKTAEWYTRLSA